VNVEKKDNLLIALDEFLRLSDLELDRSWPKVDEILAGSQVAVRLKCWDYIHSAVQNRPISLGHVYFRLGVHHLITDSDENDAIKYLELAYAEDVKFSNESPHPPQRRGAYRLLSLIKAYFEYLDAEGLPWEKEQFQARDREHQITTLLSVYDKGLVHPLDAATFTYQEFFRLMKNQSLIEFAIENFFSAEELLIQATTADSAIRGPHQNAIARAIVALLGGVLEAILADRVAGLMKPTLGALIRKGYSDGLIKKGSKLAALCSLMLFLRNHIHPDRASKQNDYRIDINVARGCKAALELVITEMLTAAAVP
jgi:hypothetical protein